MMRQVCLTAGGTGGHLFPAVSVARHLQKNGIQVRLVTDARGASLLATVNDLDIDIVPVKRAGNSLFKKLIYFITLGWSILWSCFYLVRVRPQLVVGFGGYPSFPLIVGSMILGRPLLLHEQNAFLGRVNRFAARFAKKIALSFPDTENIPLKDQGKCVLTGNPIRQEICTLYDTPYVAPEKTGGIHLLIVGGSQGAARFSSLIPDALGLLPKDLTTRLHVHQQARQSLVELTKAKYKHHKIKASIEPFIHNMKEELAQAHFVIARGGASTIAEIMVAGRPALILPYPHAMDNHQFYNGKALEATGGGLCVPEKDATPELIARKIIRFLTRPPILEKGSIALKKKSEPEATTKLFKLIFNMIDKQDI